MQFPKFDHLHFYERTQGARYDISRSNLLAYHLPEFRRGLGNFDLNWNDPTGSVELRKLIGHVHGVPANHIAVTCGATEGNFVVNAALVNRGDRVLVDLPIYSPLRDVPRGFTPNVHNVPRSRGDAWSLDPDRWRKAAGRRTRLFVLCNLNNPTSSAVGTSQLRELANLAADAGAYLLVDETFRELAFDRAPPSVATMGDHCIALSTLTKVYGLGGLRLGWIAAHPNVLERLKNVKDYTTVSTAGFSDVVGRWAVSRRAYFLRRAKRILDRNRARLREVADRVDALEGPWPEVGSVCFPRSRLNVAKLERVLMKRYDTVIAHGRYFGLADHFRLGLGGDSQEFERGIGHLEKAISDLA